MHTSLSNTGCAIKAQNRLHLKDCHLLRNKHLLSGASARFEAYNLRNYRLAQSQRKYGYVIVFSTFKNAGKKKGGLFLARLLHISLFPLMSPYRGQ